MSSTPERMAWSPVATASDADRLPDDIGHELKAGAAGLGASPAEGGIDSGGIDSSALDAAALDTGGIDNSGLGSADPDSSGTDSLSAIDPELEAQIERELDAELAAASEDGPIDLDEQVPMLTDVLQVPRYPAGELPASLDEVNWTALTERVRENVMERLMRTSTQLFDERVTQTLQVVVERATANLNIELRDALSTMIRDIVARAVDDELSRVHNEISRRASL